MTVGNPVFAWNQKINRQFPKELGIFTEFSDENYKILQDDGTILTEAGYWAGNCLLVQNSLYYIGVKERFTSYIVGRPTAALGDRRICVANFVRLTENGDGIFRDEQGEFLVTLSRQIQRHHPIEIVMIPSIGDEFQIYGSDDWHKCTKIWRDPQSNLFFLDEKSGAIGYRSFEDRTISSIRNG